MTIRILTVIVSFLCWFNASVSAQFSGSFFNSLCVAGTNINPSTAWIFAVRGDYPGGIVGNSRSFIQSKLRIGTSTNSNATSSETIWPDGNHILVLEGESNVGGGTIATVRHANNDGTSSPEFTGFRSRGTLVYPITLYAGDELVKYAGVGRVNGTFAQAAFIQIEADIGWATSAGNDAPGRIRFATSQDDNDTPVTVVLMDRMQRVFVRPGTSGAAPDSSADGLVIENYASGGMSVLTPSAGAASILLGNASDPVAAQIVYDGPNNLMTVGTANNGDSLRFRTGDQVTALTLDQSADATFKGNVAFGKAVQIKEGNNACLGVATLSDGTVTVSNTSAAANDRIFIQRVSGTAPKFGHLTYSISNGEGFTVNSTGPEDDSTINWVIIKPTP